MAGYPYILKQAEITNLIDLTIYNDCCNQRLLCDERHDHRGHADLDEETWDGAYYHGYREPRYPVPAHRYSVLFNTYSVEMVIGITKQWYPRFPEPFRGPYVDCELVAMWTSWPKDLFS